MRRVRGTSGDSPTGSAGRGRRRRGRRLAARAPERLHDDHGVRLLVIRAAQQVAPVIEPEVARDVELDAGEAGGHRVAAYCL